MKEWQDLELSNLCQQILALQASMLREQKRVELLLKEKDAIICQQKAELQGCKLSTTNTSLTTTNNNNVSVTSMSAGAFGGSLRIHGSFRQYKKDREKSGISNLAAAIQASTSARKKVVLVPPLYPEPKSRILPPALAAAAVSRKKV